MVLILLILSIAPVIFFAYQIYKRDFDKEPKEILIKLFISGIGSAFLTLILSSFLTSLIPFFNYDSTSLNVIELIPYVFIGIALIEEFSKWIFVYNLEYNDNEFNHLYDGIVYAAFVSLGFACFENIIYVMTAGIDDGVRIAIMRAILSIPGHLCFGVLMGYFLAIAKLANVNKNQSLSNKNKLFSVLAPVIAHGMFDYLLMVSDAVDNDMIPLVVYFIFVVSLFLYSSRKVKQLASNYYNLNPGYISINDRKKMQQSKFMNDAYNYQTMNNGYSQTNYLQQSIYNNYNQYINNNINRYCSNCGSVAIGKYCANCGNEIK